MFACFVLGYNKVEDSRDHPDRSKSHADVGLIFERATTNAEEEDYYVCLSACMSLPQTPPLGLGSGAIQCAHLDGTKCGLSNSER